MGVSEQQRRIGKTDPLVRARRVEALSRLSWAELVEHCDGLRARGLPEEVLSPMTQRMAEIVAARKALKCPRCGGPPSMTGTTPAHDNCFIEASVTPIRKEVRTSRAA